LILISSSERVVVVNVTVQVPAGLSVLPPPPPMALAAVGAAAAHGQRGNDRTRTDGVLLWTLGITRDTVYALAPASI
jgi:hypothetical protein